MVLFVALLPFILLSVSLSVRLAHDGERFSHFAVTVQVDCNGCRLFHFTLFERQLLPFILNVIVIHQNYIAVDAALLMLSIANRGRRFRLCSLMSTLDAKLTATLLLLDCADALGPTAASLGSGHALRSDSPVQE